MPEVCSTRHTYSCCIKKYSSKNKQFTECEPNFMGLSISGNNFSTWLLGSYTAPHVSQFLENRFHWFPNSVPSGEKPFKSRHRFWYLVEVFSEMSEMYFFPVNSLCLLPDFRSPQGRGWIFSSPNRCQKAIHPT